MVTIEGRMLRNLTVAIDQVVETPSGDFAAARGVLEQMPAGYMRDGGSTSKIHTDLDTPPRPDLFFHSIGELELMAEVHTDPPPPSFGKKSCVSTSLSKSQALGEPSLSTSLEAAHSSTEKPSHQHAPPSSRRSWARTRRCSP